jgi:hypothetical protein
MAQEIQGINTRIPGFVNAVPGYFNVYRLGDRGGQVPISRGDFRLDEPVRMKD